jgi:hypothetical protein
MITKNAGLRALTTSEERAELRAVGTRREPVKLRRTFNMTMCGQTLKFWRVIAPTTHPNINSDLSVEGLRQWGVI